MWKWTKQLSEGKVYLCDCVHVKDNVYLCGSGQNSYQKGRCIYVIVYMLKIMCIYVEVDKTVIRRKGVFM